MIRKEKSENQALENFTIYSNISEIMLLIQTTLCRNTRIQMDLSKNNRSTADEATNYISRTKKRKKAPECEMFESSGSFSSLSLTILSWNFKKIAYRGRPTFPPSSNLEQLCQHEMTSWHYIVTKSSIIDNKGVRDPPLTCFFLWKTVPKKLKFNEVDICMFKVRKKITRTRCEICPKLTIKY